MITTTAGSSLSPGDFWYVGNGTLGTQTIQQNAPLMPAAPVGDMLNLVKTADGEFVLSGANAQRLLMEYFEQAPELWLRLMALKAEEEA